MSIHDDLADVVLLIASRRQAASFKSPDDEKLWRYLRVLCHFVHVTGQVYRFEDFLSGTAPPAQPHVSARLSSPQSKLAKLAAELLFRALNEASEPEQKSVLLLIALLNFIADTGQLEDVEDFFSNHPKQAPVAIAH
ncbi:MAG TPA: hypothetical protein VF815_08700, partial [Myxococcaceae bacterium]